ncbi:MAG: OmpA family protein [Spirochaetales bacterium]|nr:OmpA family protein [Spirochaetales bacterium]
MKRITPLLPALFLLGTVLVNSIGAENLFEVKYAAGDKYKITEVSDLRKYVNKKYEGFVYRQVRGIMDVLPAKGGGFRVDGHFYVFEETKRDTRLIANQIDTVVPSSFTITPDGRYTISEAEFYPQTRDFPVFPDKQLKKGDSWRAYGVRYVEPLRDGVFTRVKFYCEYVYQGETTLGKGKYHLITAQYALRYKRGDDPKGDPRLKSIDYAGHKVSIYFDTESNKPVFMRDAIIENLGGEVYTFTDGKEIAFKGVILTWFDMIEIMDKEQVVDDIEVVLKEDDIEDVNIDETDEGVKLTLNNIHFVPDQAVILPEEKKRLEALAGTLKKIKDRSFLVIGHTALWGTEKEQYDLSVKRAKAIVDYMVSKGIEAKRFLYEGRGAREPVAPNDTEENMRKNRRVEIVILED